MRLTAFQGSYWGTEREVSVLFLCTACQALKTIHLRAIYILESVIRTDDKRFLVLVEAISSDFPHELDEGDSPPEIAH